VGAGRDRICSPSSCTVPEVEGQGDEYKAMKSEAKCERLYSCGWRALRCWLFRSLSSAPPIHTGKLTAVYRTPYSIRCISGAGRTVNRTVRGGPSDLDGTVRGTLLRSAALNCQRELRMAQARKFIDS
jgi:hypothetical protein